MERLPENYRKSLRKFAEKRPLKQIFRKRKLFTVCEEAKCPNIGECFSHKTATFLIMGDRCTRRCKFCSVTTKKPLPLDTLEPHNIAQSVIEMGLDYVVITSVDRDDLPDFGASHIAKVVSELKKQIPHIKVEILSPDFKGQEDLVKKVIDEKIEVFGHNIESVPRMYKQLRPQSKFATSLKVLSAAKDYNKCLVKTGFMVGVGESDEEIFDLLHILADIKVDTVTIGQYLRPRKDLWPVHRFISDNKWDEYKKYGQNLGIKQIFAGPFVRSSYRALETFLNISL